MATHGISGQVISIDVEPLVEFSDPRITFLGGDAHSLGEVLSQDRLAKLAHPWLVVEDSSHRYETSMAVLRFFDEWLVSGDYLVVEDGILSQFSDPMYERYEDGPNRAVAAFLESHPGRYEIDEELCDHYGYNATFNPNGWLRRR